MQRVSRLNLNNKVGQTHTKYLCLQKGLWMIVKFFHFKEERANFIDVQKNFHGSKADSVALIWKPLNRLESRSEIIYAEIL